MRNSNETSAHTENYVIGAINNGSEKIENPTMSDEEQREEKGIIGKISDPSDDHDTSWQRLHDGTVESVRDMQYKIELQRFIDELEAAGNEPEIKRNAQTEDIEKVRGELRLRDVAWKWLYDSIKDTGVEDWKASPRYFLAIAKEAKNRLFMEKYENGKQ